MALSGSWLIGYRIIFAFQCYIRLVGTVLVHIGEGVYAFILARYNVMIVCLNFTIQCMHYIMIM